MAMEDGTVQPLESRNGMSRNMFLSLSAGLDVGARILPFPPAQGAGTTTGTASFACLLCGGGGALELLPWRWKPLAGGQYATNGVGW